MSIKIRIPLAGICGAVAALLLAPVAVRAAVTTYTYDLDERIGSGNPIAQDGWTGEDLGSWVIASQWGSRYFRNNNDGDDDVGRVNDANWSFTIPDGATKLVMKTGGRSAGNSFELGLASQVDDATATHSLFRFGTAETTFLIRHWDGNGSVMDSTAGTYSADTSRTFRIEIDLLANSGDGTAALFVDGTQQVTVANMHLLDPAAPLLSTLDTLQVRTNKRFSGPGDITITTEHVTPARGGVTTHTYDMPTRIGGYGVNPSVDGWTGDDLANWLRGAIGTDAYFRNGNDGDDAIGRANDTNWSFVVPAHAERLIMETVGRVSGANAWELGLGDQVDSSGAMSGLFRLGMWGTAYQVRYWNGSSGNARATGGAVTGDMARRLRIDIDLTANGGDGAAMLYADRDASPQVTVANIHVKDAAAPELSDLDTVQIRAVSRYAGPGNFTVTTIAPEMSRGTIFVLR